MNRASGDDCIQIQGSINVRKRRIPFINRVILALARSYFCGINGQQDHACLPIEIFVQCVQYLNRLLRTKHELFGWGGERE